MNKCQLIGRLTADPEVKYYENGEKTSAVAKFTLAVDRRFKKEGEPEADFLRHIAFGKTAEFVEKYLKKGTKVWTVGHITTGSYDKDGVKHYTTDILVEEMGFCEKKSDGNASNNTTPTQAQGQPNLDGFMNIPDGIGEELPFN